MKHKHHIIPRHLKSPCPIAKITIELSVEEHAEAHRVLYETYGKIEDYVAWKSLAGMIGKKEVINLILKEAQSKGGKAVLENGNHNFFGGSIQRDSQRKLVDEGKHWSFDKEKNKAVKEKMMRDGTHISISNNPTKRKFRCKATNVVNTKTAFTRLARKEGYEFWPHELELIT